MANQVPCGGLTSVEQALVDHVTRGERLDLAAQNEVIDEVGMRSWGDSHTCRAFVIRDVLLGRLAPGPDPHGLRLRGARITDRIDLENLRTEVNLELEGCLLEEGLLARDAYLATVTVTGCHLEHPTEPPLDATRLSCRQLSLRNTSIVGRSKDGGVRLVGAHIDGNLDCDGMRLRNDTGPALNAEGVQVSQVMSLRGSTAICSDQFSGVNLSGGAYIRVELDCDRASLCNDTGPALQADGLEVGKCVFLRNGFTATGNSELGAVFLRGGYIGIRLDCTGAKLHNHSGPALEANGLQVGQSMFLRDGFTATGGRDGVAVDLRNAQVGGSFVFAPTRLEHTTDPHRRLAVDGLTYAGVPERVSPQDWRELLRAGTPGYAAQPYQQLAAGYRALGDERRTREILIAQRDDELARTRPHWLERFWAGITKITLGYGHKPGRALVGLGLVVVLSCVLAWALGSHGALAQTSKTATPGQPCTVMQQVSVGLDLNLPVSTSNVSRAQCDLTKESSSVTGTWLSAAGWMLRLLAWMFAALFIAGFTSAVRKT